MSFWLDRKFISLVSYRIPNARWKSGDLLNGRCPLCGDSAHNKRKARFYVYVEKGVFWCHCHNCGYHSTFKTFLKRIDEQLYKEYCLEQFQDNKDYVVVDPSKFKTKNIFDDSDAKKSFLKLKKISQLKVGDPVRTYMESRHIPSIWHSEFRWCPKFSSWVNTLMPGKFSEAALKHDEDRIVIPFFDRKNKFVAFQGRSIGDKVANRQRYISIQLDENVPLLWGLNRLNEFKKVYAFEGVLDALFVQNSIAICGSNFSSLLSVVDNEKLIMVYDNEPHSADARKKINHVIDQDLTVCIWPDNMPYKDVNQMIMNGYTAEHIQMILETNVFRGLSARVRLNEWSKR